MSELKPCPFCGSKAHIAQCSPLRDCDWVVSCEDEDCKVSPSTENLTRADAIAAWNRRSEEQ